jgi:RNA polymerase sigma-70 factor (ECF subfamily)
MPEETDSQLVARLLTGDVPAFEAIVSRHRAALVAVAASRLGSLEDAEDVAQEAFVQAYFRLRQLRDPHALLPWLRRIADRLALMRLRSHREEAMEPARLSELAAGNSEGEMDGFGLPAALAELPVGMRQAVSLTYLAGYTCAEAAELLGVREGTVKSRLSRARAKLKEVFAMTEGELRQGKSGDKFTQETVARLVKEARLLLAEGDIDGAARQADQALAIQVKEFFASGDDPNYEFNMEAARITALLRKEQRRQEAEANAAQYGFTLEELDWEVADIDMMEETLGKPVGRGQDTWGVPRGQVRTGFKDSRDICRRLECSPMQLSEWVDSGCPILRCWPFARFDLDRVRQWIEEQEVRDWRRHDPRELDRPIRVIFKAVEQGELTAGKAEEVITNLGWGDWG